MALCDSCLYFKRDYDEFRAEYDDVIVEGEEKEKHYCPMYADHIPFDIFNKNADCEFHEKRDNER